jgi:hypothetical protein
MSGAFDPVDGLVIEYVDSVCGSAKTLTAIAVALDRARTAGIKTLVAMPTLQLISEMSEVAKRQSAVPTVPVHIITNETTLARQTTVQALGSHLQTAIASGQLMFITHETLHRMASEWPQEAAEWELLIDEAPEVILGRQPFHLYDNWRALTGFLELGEAITDAPGLHRARKPGSARAVTDPRLIDKMRRTVEAIERLAAEGPNAAGVTQEQWEVAVKHAPLYRARYQEATAGSGMARMTAMAMLGLYCQLHPTDLKRVRRRVDLVPVDDVYRILHPVPQWALQDCPLFAEWEAWTRLITGKSGGPSRGRISICGFRRPDALPRFQRVTLLGALLKHTFVWHVWEALGVRFTPSPLIRLNQTTTLLGKRRLKIYWVTDEGWSKRLRDRSGGISAVLEAISKAAVIDPSQPVAAVVNKDDGSEESPEVVRRVFPSAVVMPHRVEGQNRFRHIDQLIHCAALNAYTPDIRFLESVLGIDAPEQRLARTGSAVYQSLMRLSLRDPTGTRDVTLVVMDKDVADWLVQWFTPESQVEVAGIEVELAAKRATGRPRKPDALTNAQRQQRWRERHR